MKRIAKLMSIVGVGVAVGAAGAGAGAEAARQGPRAESPPETSPGSSTPASARAARRRSRFPAENAGNVGIKYELPFEFTPGHLEMAPAPGGRIVVAGAPRSSASSPTASWTPGFGSGGIDRRAAAAGLGLRPRRCRRRFLRPHRPRRPRPAAADELDAGPGAEPAVLMRFNADGTADASFGNGGTLDHRLRPRCPQSRWAAHTRAPRWEYADIVIDSQNRPVLTGALRDELLDCSRTSTRRGSSPG